MNGISNEYPPDYRSISINEGNHLVFKDILKKKLLTTSMDYFDQLILIWG